MNPGNRKITKSSSWIPSIKRMGIVKQMKWRITMGFQHDIVPLQVDCIGICIGWSTRGWLWIGSMSAGRCHLRSICQDVCITCLVVSNSSWTIFYCCVNTNKIAVTQKSEETRPIKDWWLSEEIYGKLKVLPVLVLHLTTQTVQYSTGQYW